MAGKSLREYVLGQEGFSLLEVVVASVLLGLALIGTGYLFVAGDVNLAEKGHGRGALYATRSQLETLQGLPFSHTDLTAGTHEDPGNPIIIDDRGTAATGDDLQGYCRWQVVDADDPADGGGESEPDYKEVLVEVAEDFGYENILAELRSLIAP